MDSIPALTFCIPTLNRAEYVLQTIGSICNYIKFAKNIEICIYNNCSDTSYEKVEQIINQNSANFNIKYVRGSSRLDIDRSMFSVIRMATGNYIFLLGDDDFILPEGFDKLINLVEQNDLDLILMNAIILNEVNKTKLRMFDDIHHGFFTNLESALLTLKNYCSYGNIVVKRQLLDFNKFEYLLGTSHAYGCFWLTFFERFEFGLQPVIFVPNEPIVCLRAIVKTYNLLQVTFQHAKVEMDLYYDAIGPKSKRILKIYEDNFWKDQARLYKLLQYGMADNPLKLIKSYNAEFYKANRYRIFFARILTYILRPFKKTIKGILLKPKEDPC